VSCIDDISEVDIRRTETSTYTAPDEGIQALFVVCGGKAPPGASGIRKFGNNDPAENFEKRDVGMPCERRILRAWRVWVQDGIIP